MTPSFTASTVMASSLSAMIKCSCATGSASLNEVVITPRNYSLSFRNMGIKKTHYAMIGMALVADDYPLYHEAVNEKGLGMAGLNFVGNADFKDEIPGKDNAKKGSPAVSEINAYNYSAETSAP